MFPFSLILDVLSMLKMPNIRRAALIGGAGVIFIGLSWLGYTFIRQKFDNQATEIGKVRDGLSSANELNKALNLSLTHAAADRDEAERRLVELNSKHWQEAQELEIFKRENAKLQQQIAEAMADDPCATKPLPDSAIRLHSDSIKSFNAKYRTRGKTQQANITSGNVPVTGGNDR